MPRKPVKAPAGVYLRLTAPQAAAVGEVIRERLAALMEKGVKDPVLTAAFARILTARGLMGVE